MNNPTYAMIALALLLATGAPTTDAGYLDNPCMDHAKDRAQPVIEAIRAGTKADPGVVNAELLEECGITPCDQGQVGLDLGQQNGCLRPCKSSECTDPLCPDSCVPEDCNPFPSTTGAQINSVAAVCNGVPEDCQPVPSYAFSAYGIGAICSGDVVPEQEEEQETSGDSCEKTEDDFWPGGSHARCVYSCQKGSALGILVKAADVDAGTYGNTSCADQGATCNEPVPQCAGASDGVTSHAAEDQPCDGYSDEANSSPVTVICVAIGVDPVGVVCMLLEDLCNFAPSAQTRGVSSCIVTAGQVDADAVSAVVELLATTGWEPGVLSMAALHVDGDTALGIVYNAATEWSPETCEIHRL